MPFLPLLTDKNVGGMRCLPLLFSDFVSRTGKQKSIISFLQKGIPLINQPLLVKAHEDLAHGFGKSLVHRKAQFRAEYSIVEKVKNDKNIHIKYNTLVKEIRGNGRVQSVLLEDTETGDEAELPADAVFIFVGMKARTALFDTLPKDKSGYIVTNEKTETIIPGLYCAGDVRAKPFRQIITAVSDGAIAAHEAAEYIKRISSPGERT